MRVGGNYRESKDSMDMRTGGRYAGGRRRIKGSRGPLSLPETTALIFMRGFSIQRQ